MKISGPMPARMPAGYTPEGTKRKLLAFSFAEQRLKKAHNYWICTTREDGRAHAVPVWGVWLEGAFWFSTDPSSTKAKNLARDPRLVVHLESGDEAVIVDGKAEARELTKALDAAYARKYKLHLIGFPTPMVIYRVAPTVIQAWREKDFSKSATRWEVTG